MDEQKISEIEARLEKSKWSIYAFDAGGVEDIGRVFRGRSEFIHNAPSDIRSLLDEIKRLRKALEDIAEWDIGFSHSDDVDYAFESIFNLRTEARKALKPTDLSTKEG